MKLRVIKGGKRPARAEPEISASADGGFLFSHEIAEMLPVPPDLSDVSRCDFYPLPVEHDKLGWQCVHPGCELARWTRGARRGMPYPGKRTNLRCWRHTMFCNGRSENGNGCDNLATYDTIHGPRCGQHVENGRCLHVFKHGVRKGRACGRRGGYNKDPKTGRSTRCVTHQTYTWRCPECGGSGLLVGLGAAYDRLERAHAHGRKPWPQRGTDAYYDRVTALFERAIDDDDHRAAKRAEADLDAQYGSFIKLEGGD